MSSLTLVTPVAAREAVEQGWQIVDCPVSVEHVAAEDPDSGLVYCWTEERYRKVKLESPEDLESMCCPFCNVRSAGRLDKQSHRFVCVNTGCPRCGEVVDYSPIVAEVDKMAGEYFAKFPGLADAEDGWGWVDRLARQLLRRGIEPLLALQLVAAWNEVFAKPPVSRVLLMAIVDSVAGNLLEDAA